MLSSRAALCLAVLAVVPNTYGAINWVTNANGGWEVATNWSSNPAIPGSTDEVVLDSSLYTSTGARTISLNGDRTIASLKVTNTAAATGRTFVIAPGSVAGSKLTVLGGNIGIDVPATPYAGSSTAVSLTNTPVVIGNGITPVDAIWDFKVLNLSSGAKTTATMTLGEVIGIASTKVTVTGSNNPAGTGNGGSFLVLSKSSSNWNGQFVVNSTPAVEITAQATNALGSSSASLDLKTATLLTFDGITTQDAAINFTSAAEGYITSNHGGGASGTGVATLNGNLTGTSNITLNKRGSASTSYPNTVIFNGNANTLSGDVKLQTGSLRVNGSWTGAGNLTFVLPSSSGPVKSFVVTGTGSLSLAAEKTASFIGGTNSIGDTFVTVSPGTVGTIETLNLATSGAGKIIFGANSKLQIDLGGALADQLLIDGTLDLSGNASLVFNTLSTPTFESQTVLTYTGTLIGDFGSVVGVPEGFVLNRDTPGEIRLVSTAIPEPTMMSGLALLGAGLIGRRARRSR